jgi:lysophospholipase L1-like esterase
MHSSRVGSWTSGLAKVLVMVTGVLVAAVTVEGALRWMDVADTPVFESDPDYGYLMQANQSVSTRGYRFRINNLGLRGPDVALPKPQRTCRVVFVGDSITYGGGQIVDADLFVNRVQATLNAATAAHIEVINAAAPGWGIQNMAAYVSSRHRLDADVLIWVLSSVDFRRSKTSLEQHGFVTKKPWSRVLYALSVEQTRFGWAFSGGDGRDGTEDTLNSNLRVLRDVLADAVRAGIACAVVTIPAEVLRGHLDDDLDRFRSVAGSLGVRFLDVGKAFDEFPPHSLFIDGVHLNRQGHQVAGAAIGKLLETIVLASANNGSGSCAAAAGEPLSDQSTASRTVVLTEHDGDAVRG